MSPSRTVLFALVHLMPALLLFEASTARAVPLDSAALQITSPTFAPVALGGAGAGGFATSPASASLLAGTAFNGTTLVAVVPGTFFASSLQVQITGNGTGNFSGTPLAGTAPFSGNLQLLTFGISITTVPFVLGRPGAVVRSFMLPTGGSPGVIGIEFGGWTAGTTTITTIAGAHTAMGANALTPGGAGTLNLVSPIAISTSFILPNLVPTTYAFANLELTFVPEPGSLTLLLWGGVCLALAERSRQRRR